MKENQNTSKKIFIVIWIFIYIFVFTAVYVAASQNKEWTKATIEEVGDFLLGEVISSDIQNTLEKNIYGQVSVIPDKVQTLTESIVPASEYKNTDSENVKKDEEVFDLEAWSQNDKKVFDPFVITNLGNTLNLGGSKSWLIKNNNKEDGRLFFSLTNILNEENGCNDQEKSVEPNCNKDKNGELGEKVTLKISIDGVDMADIKLSSRDNKNNEINWDKLPSFVLKKNEKTIVTLHWFLGENEYNNEIQSDSVQFDFNFILKNIK